MRNILLMVTVGVLMLGCSSKEHDKFLETYEKNKDYHRQLGKTESVELSDGNVSKAVFTATYLYTKSDKKNDRRDENFIVNLYFDDEEEVSFEDGDFNITINKTQPKKVVKLSQTDPRLKDISLVSEWSQYYLFTFPHHKREKLKLVFTSDLYGYGELNFAKVAKFVFTKEVF